MKAKLVPVNNPDGTTAYFSMLPVTDDEFERLKPFGVVFDTDMLEQSMYLSHGYTVQTPVTHDLQAQLAAAQARITELESPEYQLRYEHLQQYEQMLEAKEQRIQELEAVCQEVVGALEISEQEKGISFTPTDKDKPTYVVWTDERYNPIIHAALRHLLDIIHPSA